jgi:hypothetical protein
MWYKVRLFGGITYWSGLPYNAPMPAGSARNKTRAGFLWTLLEVHLFLNGYPPGYNKDEHLYGEHL